MISSLFSGNKEELEQYFEVDFESNSESELWTMKLFPKDSMLSQGIQSIILCGNTKVLNSMQTIQVTGDSILYEFLNQRQ